MKMSATGLVLAVKTKSIFQPPEYEDGIRILITRFYPRGVERTRFHEWALSLSPSSKLLSSYKRGGRNWVSFRRNFMAELRNNVESVEAILTLNEVGKKRDIPLLCYRQLGIPCASQIV